MDFQSFAPNSRFGVPINPFPPGFQWNSVRQMLEEVLADLKNPLVQQYLLRSDPLLDAQAFSEPSNYDKKFSSVFYATSYRELSGGFDHTVQNIRLHIPTGTFENYSSGLAVDSAIDPSNAVFPVTQRFTKFTFNNLTRVQIKLSLNNDSNGHKTIQVAILKRNRGALILYSQLVFNQDLFLSAFDDEKGNEYIDRDTDSIDFSIIHASLLKSIIGGFQLHNPRDVTTSNKVGHLFKNVFSSYANSNVMMAFPIFCEGNWELFRDLAVCRRMQAWGISDRLRQVPFGPMRSLAPALLSPNGIDYDAHQNHSTNGQSVQAQSFFPVMPPQPAPSEILTSITVPSSIAAPTCMPLPNIRNPSTATAIAPLPQIEKDMTEEEKKAAAKLRKIEKRKIEKRIAAMRSNDRKTAERKKRRAAARSTQ